MNTRYQEQQKNNGDYQVISGGPKVTRNKITTTDPYFTRSPRYENRTKATVFSKDEDGYAKIRDNTPMYSGTMYKNSGDNRGQSVYNKSNLYGWDTVINTKKYTNLLETRNMNTGLDEDGYKLLKLVPTKRKL